MLCQVLSSNFEVYENRPNTRSGHMETISVVSWGAIENPPTGISLTFYSFHHSSYLLFISYDYNFMYRVVIPQIWLQLNWLVNYAPSLIVLLIVSLEAYRRLFLQNRTMLYTMNLLANKEVTPQLVVIRQWPCLLWCLLHQWNPQVSWLVRPIDSTYLTEVFLNLTLAENQVRWNYYVPCLLEVQFLWNILMLNCCRQVFLPLTLSKEVLIYKVIIMN